MKIYKNNEKSQNICEHCKQIAETTYKYSDYSYMGHVVPDILQEFCNKCDRVIAIPQQSSVRLREFREANMSNVSVRVPKHLVDVLYLIGNNRKIASDEPNTVWRIVSKFYVGRLRSQKKKEIVDIFQSWQKDDLASGKADAKLASRFDKATMDSIQFVVHSSNRNQADFLRGVIVAAKHDLLDEQNKEMVKEFDKSAFALR